MYVYFGSFGLLSYDFNGQEKWRKPLPVPVTQHGAGTLPILAGGWLVLNCDQDHDGQVSRAEVVSGLAQQHFAYIDSNKDEKITNSEWETIGRIFLQATNAIVAVRPGGKGDITSSHIAWRITQGLPYVPSPLYQQERLYLLKNGGLLSCVHALTGAWIYQEAKLGATGDYYASLVAGREVLPWWWRLGTLSGCWGGTICGNPSWPPRPWWTTKYIYAPQERCMPSALPATTRARLIENNSIFLAFVPGEVKMKHMDLTKLSSRDLAAIGGLLAKKEALLAQLQKLDRALAAYSDGGGRVVKPVGRKKRAAVVRGQLKSQIITALQAAGKAGLTVKELAEKTATKPANVHSWFYATGKKVKNIKKVGESRYAWI